LAAGGRRVSRRREENTKSEKRSHCVAGSCLPERAKSNLAGVDRLLIRYLMLRWCWWTS
jgi:hypothetical protein